MFMNKQELLFEVEKIGKDILARMVKSLQNKENEVILEVLNSMKREYNDPKFQV